MGKIKPYVKTDWVPGLTPVTRENMTNIEEQIESITNVLVEASSTDKSAGAIVVRNSEGKVEGDIAGNSGTTTKFDKKKLLKVTGVVNGQVQFDGSEEGDKIEIATTLDKGYQQLLDQKLECFLNTKHMQGCPTLSVGQHCYVINDIVVDGSRLYEVIDYAGEVKLDNGLWARMIPRKTITGDLNDLMFALTEKILEGLNQLEGVVLAIKTEKNSALTAINSDKVTALSDIALARGSALGTLEQYMHIAENGGNANSVQGYVPRNFKRTEDTIADLVSSASNKYRIGDVVELNGYYTAGDGAGHKRKIEATDDGSGVQLANGLWANLCENVCFNEKELNFLLSVSDCENVKLGKNISVTTIINVDKFKSINFNGYELINEGGTFQIGMFSEWNSFKPKHIYQMKLNCNNKSNIFLKLGYVAKLELYNSYIYNYGETPPFQHVGVDEDYGYEFFADYLKLGGKWDSKIGSKAEFKFSDSTISALISLGTEVKFTGSNNTINKIHIWGDQPNGLINTGSVNKFNNITIDSVRETHILEIGGNSYFRNIFSLASVNNDESSITCIKIGNSAKSLFDGFSYSWSTSSKFKEILNKDSANLSDFYNFTAGKFSVQKNSNEPAYFKNAKFKRTANITLENGEMDFQKYGKGVIINYGEGEELKKIPLLEYEWKQYNDTTLQELEDYLKANDWETSYKRFGVVYNNKHAHWDSGSKCFRNYDGTKTLSTTYAVLNLDTPYYTLKMQQEGVYEDFVSYMDEKLEYDKEQRLLEEQRQLAFKSREDQEKVYEEWLAEQPMQMSIDVEPVPSEKLLEFKKKYLG